MRFEQQPNKGMKVGLGRETVFWGSVSLVSNLAGNGIFKATVAFFSILLCLDSAMHENDI